MNRENIGSWIVFVVTLCILASWLSACSVKFELGYHGQTGVSDTTITKDFVDGPRKITDRRY